jgi:hypothetical protein
MAAVLLAIIFNNNKMDNGPPLDINGKTLEQYNRYKLGNDLNAPICVYLGTDSPNNNLLIFDCKLDSGRKKKLRRQINYHEDIVPFVPVNDHEVWTDGEDSDVDGGGEYGGIKNTKKRNTKKRNTKKRNTKKRNTKKRNN